MSWESEYLDCFTIRNLFSMSKWKRGYSISICKMVGQLGKKNCFKEQSYTLGCVFVLLVLLG